MAQSLSSRLALQRSAFSTSTRRLQDGSRFSAFSLKNLGATRGTRAVLVLGILSIGFVEGIGWMKFAPKIFGGGGDSSSAEPESK